MRIFPRPPLATALAVFLVTLGGCLSGAPERAPVNTPRTDPSGTGMSVAPAVPEAPATRPSDAPPTQADSLGGDGGASGAAPSAFGGTTGRSERAGPPAAPGMPRLRAVRTASHAGFDRIVFEFDGADGQSATVPGYRIGYEAAPTRCGSGNAVAVNGAALVVEMQPTAAHTDAGQPTLSVRRLTPGHESVRALEQTCDFEALVAWTVGVAARRPYRVRELATPARLVVDVSHTPR